MGKWFFDSPEAIYRTLAIGGLAYVVLISLLRVSGKRTLAKLNAFDLVVTVALGSTLATVLLTKDVSLVQGVLALALLIAMQFVVTWLSVRVRWLRRAVRSRPTLLLFRGEMLRDAMDAQRVTEAEVLSAIRGAGVAQLQEVEGVVLETDGSLSVIRRPPEGSATSMRDVDGIHRASADA
ncbi:MAG: DUF421 domain-containing protein [Planctomycetaceae bacterium]